MIIKKVMVRLRNTVWNYKHKKISANCNSKLKHFLEYHIH